MPTAIKTIPAVLSSFIINSPIINDKTPTAEIKIATPYFKPTKNKTDRKPDYYLHETDEWLVFPHELDGLTIDEIKKNKPELADIIDNIAHLIK